jgi:flagellar hook-length control protein FliK
VIAITTYTEPVPVDAVVSNLLSNPLNEPLKTNEPEESEERQSFSEILAGLLHQTQSVDLPVPETGFDEFSMGQVKDGEFDLSAGFQEIDTEVVDLELSQEFQNILLQADQLFTNSLEVEFAGENEISFDINMTETLVPADELTQTVSFAAETEQVDSTAQFAAAFDAAKNISESEELADNKKRTNISSNPENAEALSFKDNVGEGRENSIAKPDEIRENPGRLEEFRNRSRKDKVNIEVRDFRTANADGTQTRSYSVVETAVGRSHGQNVVQEITLDLRLPDQGQGSQAQNTWEVKSGNMLENMLARELHQNFNGDIVRHASMALRDGGAGTIKIALHPETLGNVKIRLEMTENKITGRIVVESEEALNAFRKELSALEQAFKDSGFSAADLNLSMSADGSGDQSQELDEGFFDSRIAASNYEDGYEQDLAPVINVVLRHGSGLVNMLA